MLGDPLERAIFRIQVQQVVPAAQHLATLVQLSNGDADIVFLSMVGDIDQLPRGERDSVDTAKGGEECNGDGSG